MSTPARAYGKERERGPSVYVERKTRRKGEDREKERNVELDVDRVDLIDHVRERAQELLELGVLAGRDVVLVERASCVRK